MELRGIKRESPGGYEDKVQRYSKRCESERQTGAKSVREKGKVRMREDLWTYPSPLLGEIKSRERKREEKKQTVISPLFAT